MEIDISGRHFHVLDALKAYALEKVSKLDKYSLKIENAHVVFPKGFRQFVIPRRCLELPAFFKGPVN